MDSSREDLIIGQATHFDWVTLEPFARSIVKSGFQGKKVLFIKSISQEARENLLALGFELSEIDTTRPQTKDFFQGAGRLLQAFYYITKNKFRYVFSVDTRDLVFQLNPSKWLEDHLGDKKLVASSEFIPHTNEAWNASNIQNVYPEVEEWIANKNVYCSGVIAGEAEAVAEVSLNVYYIARHVAAAAHGIDQAAYNITMHQKAFQEITKIPSMADAWAVNLQVMAAPSLIDTYRPWLNDDEPDFRNGVFYPKGSSAPFTIAHQYDRISDWVPAIRSRYCQDPRL